MMTSALTAADRKRLTAILGMLGSNSIGERDNAARLAETFRRKHGLTWADLLAPPASPLSPPPPKAAATSASAPRPEADMRFHAAGSAAYPDWAERCLNLEKSGVDVEFQQILVGWWDGVRLAFALSCDLRGASAIARLSGLARLIALAEFADSLEGHSGSPPPKAEPRPTPHGGRRQLIHAPTAWFERYLISAAAKSVGAFRGAIWVIAAVTVIGGALIFGTPPNPKLLSDADVGVKPAPPPHLAAPAATAGKQAGAVVVR